MAHSWLTSKAKTKDSGIAGKGTYAIKDIAKGETVAIFGGHILDTEQWRQMSDPLASLALPLDENFLIAPLHDHEAGDGDYVNHSCDPNTGIKGQLYLVAMRDIGQGEEITFDYAMILAGMPDDECMLECNCGKTECRGKITSDDWKDQALQKKYKGYFSTYIQEKIALDEKNN